MCMHVIASPHTYATPQHAVGQSVRRAHTCVDVGSARHKPGSAIVNTTSIQAFQGSGGMAHYATTKGGIVSLTRALAQDAIKQGVRVNAVALGPVWTPLIVSTMDAETYMKFGADNPMGRPIRPTGAAMDDPDHVLPSHTFILATLAGDELGVGPVANALLTTRRNQVRDTEQGDPTAASPLVMAGFETGIIAAIGALCGQEGVSAFRTNCDLMCTMTEAEG